MFEPAGRVYALPALTINFLGEGVCACKRKPFRRRTACCPNSLLHPEGQRRRGRLFWLLFWRSKKSDRLPDRTRLVSTKRSRWYAKDAAIGDTSNATSTRALHPSAGRPHPNLPPYREKEPGMRQSRGHFFGETKTVETLLPQTHRLPGSNRYVSPCFR
jgi:hypothetical protein